jgi:hypothetical protein
MGIARVFLAQARPTSVKRGHEHPCGKKRLLRNGPELRDGVACQDNTISRLDRMFMARHTGGLWHI